MMENRPAPPPVVPVDVEAMARLRPELAAELRVWAALHRPPAPRSPSRDATRAR